MKREIYLEKISQKTGITKKDIDLVVKEFLNELVEVLVEHKKCSITNVGTLKVTKTRPFSYFSPKDGSNLTTDGVIKVSFKISRNLLEKLSEGK